MSSWAVTADIEMPTVVEVSGCYRPGHHFDTSNPSISKASERQVLSSPTRGKRIFLFKKKIGSDP